MWDKFGEFDSWEEINRAAKAQLEEGDMDAVRAIAKENGIDPEDAEDFCTGTIEELTVPALAAVGKLEVESKDLQLTDCWMTGKDLSFRCVWKTEKWHWQSEEKEKA